MSDEKNEGYYETVQCPHCKKYVNLIPGEENICPYCKEPIDMERQEKSPSFKERFRQMTGKRKSKIVKAGCIVIACMIVISWFGSVNESGKLRNAMADLQTSYDKLEENYSQLETDYDKLEKNYQRAEEKLAGVEDQKEQIDALKKQTSELTEANKKLTEEKDSLNAQLADQAEKLKAAEAKSAAAQTASDTSQSSGSLGNTSTEEVGSMVWISATGSKYHSIPNCGRMDPNRATQMSVSEAQSRGYTPCSKCF